MKIKNLHIKEFKGLRDISINFEKNDKPLDLVVLAGSNGTGKTRVLESILEYFQDYIYHNYKRNSNKIEMYFEEKENICRDNVGNEMELYAGLKEFNDNETNNPQNEKHIKIKKELDILPKVIYVPTEINFQKMDIAITNLVQKYEFLNIVNTNLIKDIPSYIATKMISEMFKNKNEKVEDIQRKVFDEINEIFENLNIDVKVEDISQDGRNITLFTNPSGDEFDINELSSGEKQLFLRTLAIKMLNPENSIILIDEPELSLHPKWQQRIVDVYRKIGENNQIIIATHSPHILGSVKKENIMLLDKNDEGKIIVKTGNELYNSYGQPTDRVLKDIMGLKTTRNPKVFKLLEEAGELVDKNEYDSEEFKTKYKELRDILGKKDEDLLLMDMDIQIRKKRGLKNVESE